MIENDITYTAKKTIDGRFERHNQNDSASRSAHVQFFLHVWILFIITPTATIAKPTSNALGKSKMTSESESTP